VVFFHIFTGMVSIYDTQGMEKLRSQVALQPDRMRHFLNAFFKKGASLQETLARLPESARVLFEKEVAFQSLVLVDRQDSSLDGSTKLVFQTEDGALVESVLMRPETGRVSLCISSQVGCACGCCFCATGKMGFARNLSVEEILDQVAQANRLIAAEEGRLVRNVVFMGMGEPLLNIENLFGALEILSAVPLFNYSPTRLMISTVGIPEKMITFSARFPRVRLALSLHSARPSVREALMPFAQRYPLDQLAPVLKTLSESGKIMVEYLMLKGVNDQLEDLEALMHYLKGLRVHINLIPFNAFPGCSLEGTSREDRKAFATKLKKQGFETTLRHSFGTDIAAACGQLAQRKNLS
jgi:23S rRNA (adenine2503-C2)-methyltransferase